MLESALVIVISRVGHIFNIKDIKALRRTSKVLMQLFTPLITKLKINIDELDEDDTKAMAASSLLDHIHSLEITGRGGQFQITAWKRHGTSLLSILERCALDLEVLDISTCHEDYYASFIENWIWAEQMIGIGGGTVNIVGQLSRQ